MRKIIIIISIALLLISFVSFIKYRSSENKVGEELVQETDNTLKETVYNRIKAKADSAKVFCKQKGFSTKQCFLVDFNIHSGKNRFFVWDFEKDTIILSSLCCHGYGKKSTQSKPVFSNVEGSYCSSLGRYKIGDRAYSQYGINVHYKLHGLDKTNSNAFKRWVVLHSYQHVPKTEIYPSHLPLGYSLGCPVISDDAMRKVDAILKKTGKPIMLWIYN